jgi:glutaredoxin-like protein
MPAASREKQRVPEVTFRTRKGHEWVNRTTSEIFDGRTVAVFALPGAFTPTCSSTHVPRYNQLAPALKAAGVDEIVCISVNDPFVMNEWQESQHADRVTFLPDGNGEFTAGMGMLVGKEDIGFGSRSWRYSMVVRNGIVEKMFVEPEEPGDPFKVSDADTMLAYLAPRAPKPLDVTVFSRKGCPHCARAKDLLARAGIRYEELVLNKDFSDQTLRAIVGRTSVPQIFVNGTHVGGADDLERWLAERRAA